MIRVLVGDQNRVQGARIFTNLLEAREGGLPAQPGVDEDAGARSSDEGGITRTTAGEYTDSDDYGLRDNPLLKQETGVSNNPRSLPLCW